MVVPAALIPVAELLDQSENYVALVAMRPGHATQVFAPEELGAIPGDHYEVVHLGHSPYDPEWEDFLTEAVQAQLGGLAFTGVPNHARRFILTVARDSLRTGLELVLACRMATTGQVETELATALGIVRENHLVAAQRVLKGHHPDYRRLVSDIREELLSMKGKVSGPVHLEIQDNRSPTLWERNTQVDGFIDAALRSRAACMPNGNPWVPGLRVREVEIPPAILWHEGDVYWDYDTEGLTIIRRSEKALFGRGWGKTQPGSIFVAYRMDFPTSVQFRETLEAVLNQQPDPIRVSVVDGKVRVGEEWAVAIRERIKRSRLVVGDVTGLRNDVVFELGFGFGLRKPFLPVVESPGDKGHVPSWLRAKQIGSFATEGELYSVASSIIAHISDRGVARPKKIRDPVPGLAIWLRKLQWSSEAYARFEAACEREGMSHELLDDDLTPESWIDQAPRACLLIACLDQTQTDSVIHFICGGIIANPSASYGTRSLARRILLIGSPDRPASTLAADSLLRCSDTVSSITVDKVFGAVSDYARQYRTWLKSPPVVTRP